MSNLDLSGLNNVVNKLDKVENITPGPLMESLEKIIRDGNRKGILSGLDKDGNRMQSVTYRPKGQAVSAKNGPKHLRNGRKGSERGAFAGFGPMAAGLHNNLTNKEYQKLNGPPLAPRGDFSRVITNFVTGFFSDPRNKIYTIVAGWREVVDTKGRDFLQRHFKGEGDLPKRDLAGIRPVDLNKCRESFVEWARDQIRNAIS